MNGSFRYPGATESFIRIINAFSLGPDNPQSEDCLTLNIWSKARQGQKKAVLVWLYGGGQFRLVTCKATSPALLILGDLAFRIGTTNTPFYQGQYIAAAQDIVFVSVKYASQLPRRNVVNQGAQREAIVSTSSAFPARLAKPKMLDFSTNEKPLSGSVTILQLSAGIRHESLFLGNLPAASRRTTIPTPTSTTPLLPA